MKKIIIIGGEIAGLSVDIYAKLHGFESIIYEKHSISGALCTGCYRISYQIDGCIHCLTETYKSRWIAFVNIPMAKQLIYTDNIKKLKMSFFAVASRRTFIHSDKWLIFNSNYM